MHIADCMELYLARHAMPTAEAAYTTQLEQTQEAQLATVQSGGPGSGRHPEFGSFKKTVQTQVFPGHTYYKGSAGTVVHVHEPINPMGKTSVGESGVGGHTKFEPVWQGHTSGGASQHNDFHDFMKSRYGINHGSDDSHALDSLRPRGPKNRSTSHW